MVGSTPHCDRSTHSATVSSWPKTFFQQSNPYKNSSCVIFPSELTSNELNKCWISTSSRPKSLHRCEGMGHEEQSSNTLNARCNLGGDRPRWVPIYRADTLLYTAASRGSFAKLHSYLVHALGTCKTYPVQQAKGPPLINCARLFTSWVC